MAKKQKHVLSVLETEARTGFLARMKKQRNQLFKQGLKHSWFLKWFLSADETDRVFSVLFGLLALTVAGFAGAAMKPILGLVLPCVAFGILHVSAPSIDWVSHFRQTRKRLGEFSARGLILEFHRKRIEDMKVETIGNETPFQKQMNVFRGKRHRLDGSLKKVRTLTTQHTLRFATRSTLATPFLEEESSHSSEEIDEMSLKALAVVKEPIQIGYLTPLSQKLNDRLKELQDVIAKGEKFVALVHEWESGRLKELNQLDETLKEREVIDEALQACEDARGITEEGDLIIAQAIAVMNERIQDAREEIQRFYEESGVALAISAAETGETFDVKMLDRVIADHVPAKLEVVKNVS